jgi:hypothetical protein
MGNKKVLIIAYYWPPAGGPGVQRWLKFVKYLIDFNIEPIVYVPENPNYPIVDESLINEIPDDLTVLRQSIKEPYKMASLVSGKKSNAISKGIIPESKKQSLIERFLLFIRGNFFIPDARKSWVKPSVKYLSAYIEENNIKTIITTGPPHSMHLIGCELKKNFNIKWFADFRDPWTTIGYHKKLKLLKFAKAKHKKLEAQILQNADQIIVTSPSTKQEFTTITNRPIEVITNGYDNNRAGKLTLDYKFTLSHIGSLLSERNPETLWQVLSEIVRDNKVFQSQFQINLVGAVSKEVLSSLEAFGLSQFINLVGYVSHEEAIRYQKQSQLLLLIEIDSEDTKCIIPGKLFEYMVSNRPILALGPEDSDVEQIIKSTNTGDYFTYKSYESLRHKILDCFESFRRGELQSHGIGLQQYHRKALTEQLVDLIQKAYNEGLNI